MKKTTLTALFLSFLCFAGCYKAPTADSTKSSTKSPPNSTPLAEKSASPAPQSSPAPQADFGKAVDDFNAKRYDEAEKGFNAVLESEPNNADAHYYLGNIYYARRDHQKSLPHFEQAAKIDFKSVEKLIALAENQRALAQFDRAVVQYQKALGFAPGNADAYYGLGLTYIGLNNKIAARQQLQKLAPLNQALADKLSQEIDGKK